MSETDLVRAILDMLRLERGCFAWRNQTGATKGGRLRYGLPGSADIFAIVAPYGRLLAIECKVDKGKQSELQEKFAKAVEQQGAIYIVARSVHEARSGLLAARIGHS